MPQPLPDDDALLDRLRCETFEYFLKEVYPLNGLIPDKTRDGWPASIAATPPRARVLPHWSLAHDMDSGEGLRAAICVR